MIFKEQIETYLKDLPSKWSKQLTTILCEINSNQQTVDCEDVRMCETLTSLSPFTVNGTEVSIKYKDEHEITITRSFDLDQVINKQLESVSSNCLTDQNTWDSLTLSQRLQLLVNSHCDCCP